MYETPWIARRLLAGLAALVYGKSQHQARRWVFAANASNAQSV